MRRWLLLLALLASLSMVLVATEMALAGSPEPSPTANADGSALAGKWIYRSFHNSPAPVGDDASKALDLIFAEAVFTFEIPSPTTLKGAIDWQGGGLDLQGTIKPGAPGDPVMVEIVGTGRPNTGTAGWEYDYYGQLAHRWPNAVNQVPALVGSVIRAKPHGAAPAGYTASFIAVKQP